MKRIALDLELNNEERGQTTEIIQLGYTIFDLETGEMKTSGDYVKGEEQLTNYITKLTGISQTEIDKRGVSLETAYKNLVKFCQDNLVEGDKWQLVTWGGGDLSELKKQLEESGSQESWKFGRSELNLKSLFQFYCIANNKKSNGGLGRSLKKEGLSFIPFLDKVTETAVRQRGAHDARADALNTAQMYIHLQNKMRD